MSFGAFSRTRILRLKEGTTMAVEKWWKKQRPAAGEITQHINANEQHILLPWIKTFPKKMMDRAPTYMYPLASLILINIGVTVAFNGDHQEDVDHRY